MRLTRQQQHAIVAREFKRAGWSDAERPEVTRGELSDGRYWEPAKRTAAGLKAQCRAWIESFK